MPLVLACSSSALNNQSLKKKGIISKQIVHLQSDYKNYNGIKFVQKAPSLPGINLDIKNIQQHHQELRKSGFPFNQDYNKLHIIKSSKHQNCLLSRKQIMNKIVQFFKSSQKYSIYVSKQNKYCQNFPAHKFIYTGHGYYNGDMCIQTKQNPQGQPFTLQQLIQLWRVNKNQKASLEIVFDCCYAGMNVQKYYNIYKPMDNIKSILASSGPNLTSFATVNYGSLLIFRNYASEIIWKESEKNQLLRKQLFKLFQSRKPISFSSSHRQKNIYLKQISQYIWSGYVQTIIQQEVNQYGKPIQ